MYAGTQCSPEAQSGLRAFLHDRVQVPRDAVCSQLPLHAQSAVWLRERKIPKHRLTNLVQLVGLQGCTRMAATSR